MTTPTSAGGGDAIGAEGFSPQANKVKLRAAQTAGLKGKREEKAR